jgi:hypothetical protein
VPQFRGEFCPWRIRPHKKTTSDIEKLWSLCSCAFSLAESITSCFACYLLPHSLCNEFICSNGLSHLIEPVSMAPDVAPLANMENKQRHRDKTAACSAYMQMKSSVSQNMTPCSLEVYRRFGETLLAACLLGLLLYRRCTFIRNVGKLPDDNFHSVCRQNSLYWLERFIVFLSPSRNFEPG